MTEPAIPTDELLAYARRSTTDPLVLDLCDEVDRLREQDAALYAEAEALRRVRDHAVGDRAALDRVRELHFETNPGPEWETPSWCPADGQPWPCPTICAIDGGE